MYNFKFYYQNVRGLRTKLEQFYANALNADVDVLCITETWLHSGIYSSEVLPSAFSVYRNDRGSDDLVTRRGGGVLIGVVSALNSFAQPNWFTDVEAVSVTINCGTLNIHVCCAYIPPGSAPKLYEFTRQLIAIVRQHPDDKFVICGDFNLPEISWTCDISCICTASSAVSPRSVNFIDSISLCELNQYNHFLNSSDHTLDLIFARFLDVTNFQRCMTPLVDEDVAHTTLEFTCNVMYHKNLTQCSSTCLNFKKASFVDICKYLNGIQWDVILNGLGVDEAVDELYLHLNVAINQYVPRLRTPFRGYPVWFTRDTVRVIREKIKAHRRWKRYGNCLDYLTFSLLRGRAKFLIDRDHKNYLDNVESNIVNDAKQFWTYVKRRKGGNGIPSVVKLDGDVAASAVDICSLFSRYFSSVFTVPGKPAADVGRESSCTNISIKMLELSEVQQALREVAPNKGPGPDGVPSIIINKCWEALSKPLLKIYNLSISCGQFPSLWKQARVVPIFKSGDRSKVDNYRPISLLCIMGKILEKIVYGRIFFIVRPLLTTAQHGFISGRSVETNLLYYTDQLLLSGDDQNQVDAIYTDFSKAFDRVDHEILILKLRQIGICPRLVDWFRSYITGRTQAVVIGDATSQPVPVTSGVPQGSHLGPLLFNIFINDVASCFHSSQFLMYADDLKIFSPVTSLSDCLAVQSDLDRFYYFCINNGLQLNSDKCSVITFTKKRSYITYEYKLNTNIVTRVSTVRDLGITFDRKLKFDEHIDGVVRRAYRMLGFIKRSTVHFTNPAAITSLYMAYVLSTLMYSSTVWNPQYSVYIERLEAVQKRFVKYLCFKFGKVYTDYVSACDMWGILTLRQRRYCSDAMFLFKLVNGVCDAASLLSRVDLHVPPRRLRYDFLFYAPSARTSAYRNSPVLRMERAVDRLGVDVFGMNVLAYRRHIRARVHDVLIEDI